MVRQSGTHLLGSVAHDHHLATDAGSTSRLENPVDQATPGRLVQHLRHARLHPTTLAGSQHDRNRRVHQKLTPVRSMKPSPML